MDTFLSVMMFENDVAYKVLKSFMMCMLSCAIVTAVFAPKFKNLQAFEQA